MKKIVFRLMVLVMVILVIILAPFCLGSAPFDINFSKTENSQVISMWHIETFEGGSVSRLRYLEKQSIAFEKKYPGKLLLIINLTYDEAKEKIVNGEIPDMVSFGVGAGDLFVDNVKEIDIKSNFRSDLLQYGTINNKLCAVPYMIGGYCKITYDNYDNLYVRKENEEIVNQDNKIVVDDTQYQLYQNFISQKYDGILGTQRDFYRINNRINLGKMDNCNFEYISGYNDLIQYMAITSNVASEIQIAENFIEFILSEDGQIAIKDYGMFSVNRSIYSSGEYKNFENEILKEINSVNAFVGRNNV